MKETAENRARLLPDLQLWILEKVGDRVNQGLGTALGRAQKYREVGEYLYLKY